MLGAQQQKWAPALPGSARGACLLSVHFCYLHSSQCQLCHRVDVEQQVPAPHRASVFPLYNRRVGQSNLARVEKCDGALGPPGGGFLGCARVLPAKGRAAADGAVPGSYLLGPLRALCHFGASSLASGCLRFWREGEAGAWRPCSYHILSAGRPLR